MLNRVNIHARKREEPTRDEPAGLKRPPQLDDPNVYKRGSLYDREENTGVEQSYILSYPGLDRA